MKYMCLVCGYEGLHEPAYKSLSDGSYDYTNGSFDICECCGFQFGYTNFALGKAGHQQWRERWIKGGMKWHFKSPPSDWNPEIQLEKVHE